jgi:hypothetical protein
MFKGRFTRIKDLSERRRLPRLGKIRLGVKMISDRTHKEYPKETEFFIVPPEVTKVYGDRPTSLEVMVPINDPEAVFPQAYKWYGGQRGLKCIGDGGVALRLKEETQTMEEIPCPCERLETAECQKRGHFMVILPRINMGGVYQIDVGSYHSIVDINSGLEYVQALVGRFAMVPLRLCRAPKETHFGGQKQIHYTLQLFLDADVDTVNALREDTSRVLLSTRSLALPPPEDMDENGVIKEETEEEVEPVKPEKPEKPDKLDEGSGSREKAKIPARSDIHQNPIKPLQEIAIERIARAKGINLPLDRVKFLSYDKAALLIKQMQVEKFDPREFFEGIEEEGVPF